MHVEELCRSDAKDILSFIKSGNFCEDFNWLLLAEVAFNEICGDPSKAREWCMVAISCCYRLSLCEKEKTSKVMASLAKYLSIAGCDACINSLSLKNLIDWFYEDINDNEFSEVVEKYENFLQLNLQEIKLLRNIKNKVNVLLFLDSKCYESQHSYVLKWLSIKHTLP